MKNIQNPNNSVRDLSNKPWRNADGTLKSDETLKKSAINWSPSTWEAYLTDIHLPKQPHRPEEEILVSDPSGENIFSTEKYLDSFIAELKVKYFPSLGIALRKALTTLPRQQLDIITSIFWEGLTIRETADKCGVTRQAIHIQMGRAIGKLRSEILKELRGKKRTSRKNHVCLTDRKSSSGTSTS